MLTPEFIEKEDVIKIHDDHLETYGGEPGILNEQALESAIAQACVTWDGEFLHPTIFHQASAYLFHIANAHAFLDGNKRTAFAVMNAFLEMNGYCLELSEDKAYELTMSIMNIAEQRSCTKDEVADILQVSCICIDVTDTTSPSLDGF